MPGAFKLDHLHPVKPILLRIFSTLDYHAGGYQLLITPETDYEGKGFTQKWMRPRGFSAWGIQTRPFVA